jgi:hypothetical protein
MSEPGKGVTVTITPDGQVCDIAVDGHSIAHVVPRGGVDLTIGGHGDLPRLGIVLAPDKITVKGDDHG